MGKSLKTPSVLVALNQFKGTLSNREACDIVADSLGRKDFHAFRLPIGDGGRGTIDAVHTALGGEFENFESVGPMGKPVEASVLCLPNRARPNSIYIESASVCGHQLIPEQERDAIRASSHGLGILIQKVLQKWKVPQIYVGLGDSAISDAGMGMLSALGFQFFDSAGKSVWGNANGLRAIHTLQIPKTQAWHKTEFTVLCDVLNPLCGPDGSARTFAPQKGASGGQVSLIEQGMENFAQKIYETTRKQIRHVPMTGSAGGLSAAFAAFFKTKLVHGARFLLDWLHFDQHMLKHAFVITGEGQTDSQTLSGKAPMEVIKRAQQAGKKVLIVSGSLGPGHKELLKNPYVIGCYACGKENSPESALESKVEEIFSDAEILERLEE